MDMTTNLLIDFGESSLRYVVLEETDEEATIRDIYESVNSGSAPQLGNNSNAYVSHIKTILETIDKIVKAYAIDSILLNLPSIHDELVVLQDNLKRMSQEDQIRNANEFFNTDDMVLYGPLKRVKDNYSIVAVSSVQKEFAKILDSIKDTYTNTTMYITTSFIRLQLISEFLEIEKPHAIIDSGYSKTRAMVFDEDGVPTNAFSTSLCGKDIVDLMVDDRRLGNRDYVSAIHDFNHMIGLTNEVKEYVNKSLKATKQIIKQNILSGSQIVFCGGLSTLPWAKLLSNTDYEVEVLYCDAISARGGKALAAVAAPLLYMDITSCSIIQDSDEEVEEQLELEYSKNGEVESEEEVENDPFGIGEDEDEDDMDSYDVSEEEESSEEEYEEVQVEEVRSPRKKGVPRKSTKPSEPPKPKRPAKRGHELEEDEEEEYMTSTRSINKPPTGKQSKSKKPVKPNKKHVKRPEPEEDEYEDEQYGEDEESEDDKPKRKNKNNKQPKKKGGFSIIFIFAALVVAIGIGCMFTFKMYLSHKATAEQTVQEVAKSSQSLTDYVKAAADSVGLQIATENSEVLGTMEYYYIGLDDVTKDAVQELANILTECNFEILNKEDLANGNVNVTLKLSFK